MSAAANHFAHREAGEVVVDLFWDRGKLEHEFRVEVEIRADGTHFVLYPTTGKAAVHAFHHPFAAASPLPPRPADDAIGWTTDTDAVNGW
jgi:hypothetical protein